MRSVSGVEPEVAPVALRMCQLDPCEDVNEHAPCFSQPPPLFPRGLRIQLVSRPRLPYPLETSRRAWACAQARYAGIETALVIRLRFSPTHQ